METHGSETRVIADRARVRYSLSRLSGWPWSTPARIGLSFLAGVLADLSGAPQFLVLPTMLLMLAILHLVAQALAPEPWPDG